MKLLIGVVVYDRLSTIERWLKAWSKATKPTETKLAVFNNYDGNSPPAEQSKLILAGTPDFYIPRNNIGCDLGALQDVANGLYVDYDWDVLGWFVDDFIPMKRDFLSAFVEKFDNPKVGLVGACYEPSNESNKNAHFRTVGFMIRKEVLHKLQFPATPMLNRYDAFQLEHGENNMMLQVEQLGYDVLPAIGNKFPEPGYSHWPNNSTWMWDCSLLEEKNLWSEFEREFV